MNNLINVLVAGKIVKMEVYDAQQMGPASTADMIQSGWEPVAYFAKRVSGRKHHMVYKSAKSGVYKSIVAV